MVGVRLRPQWPPSRRRAISAVLCTALILGGVVAVTSGLLAGITLLVGFSGVLSLTLLLVPARPHLAATLRGVVNVTRSTSESGVLVAASRVVRPLDIEAIVESEEEKARETMPRRPTPRYPPSSFGGIYDSAAALTNAFAVGGATDDELRDFLGKVSAYGDELRGWLEQLQESRAEDLRHFAVAGRVEEQGQASADFVRLRLAFPPGFEEPARTPWVPEPPRRPEFTGRFGGISFPRVAPMALRRGALHDLVASSGGMRGDAADYSSENGMIVVVLNVGHVNQREYRDTSPFSMRAAAVGVHEMHWRISASSLGSPTEGTVQIEVLAPVEGEPIRDLADALHEREAYGLD